MNELFVLLHIVMFSALKHYFDKNKLGLLMGIMGLMRKRRRIYCPDRQKIDKFVKTNYVHSLDLHKAYMVTSEEE